MNITTESSKLLNLVNHALIGSKALMPQATVQFSEEAVHLGSNYMGAAVSVYGAFKKAYFGTPSKYKVTEDELVVVTKALQKTLANSFADKVVNMTIDKDNLLLVLKSEDGDTEYSEPLKTPTNEVLPSTFPVPMVITEQGYLPVGKSVNKQDRKAIEEYIDSRFPVRLFVDKSKLYYAEADSVVYEFVNGILKSRVEGTGTLRQKIPFVASTLAGNGHADDTTELALKLSSNFLNPVLSVVQGNVWLCMHKQSLVLAESADKFMVTYILGTMNQ